jgi:RimJ/RimL family protein N-acetyltransferase
MGHRVLPDLVGDSDAILLRRWTPADAETLDRLVLESLDHLRPWMPWIGEEPLGLRRRRELIAAWERDWQGGGDVYLGIFLDGRPAGSCGLHRRIGRGGLEIGYWIHPAFLRRGLATEVARLLTDAALSRPDVDHVEIHHDKANRASAGIPCALGFTMVGEERDQIPDPGGVGVSLRWRMTRSEWADESTA